MRCPRCGNENPVTNRFCGTCGGSLLAANAQAGNASQTTAVRNAGGTGSGPRGAAPKTEEPPAINGPSFLGLNAAAGAKAGPKPRHDTDPGTSSRNLAYLLEDDEEHKGGAGKIFLVLIALGLALGFGYLRWRHEGLSSLWPGPKKSSTQSATQAAGDAGVPSSDSTSAGGGSGSAADKAPAAASPQTPAGADSGNSAPGTPESGAGAAATSPAPASSPDAGSGAGTAADHAGANPAPDAANAPSADKATSDTVTSSDAAEKPSEPAPARKAAAAARPAPKPSAAKAFDQVTEAEKYIYGRGGMRQDCDRGLRMLRPAAEQANPRAMISLGALYSTGVCAPKDLPTAYRWFALALRKQPDNQPLQENLQRLWGQMTQPERQLAVKLSQ